MIPYRDPCIRCFGPFRLAIGLLAGLTLLGSGCGPADNNNDSPEAETAPARADPENESAAADTSAKGETPALTGRLADAFSLIHRGRTEDARAMLREGDDDTSPRQNGLAAFLVALSYHQEFRYGAARPYFERAADLAPNYPPLYHFFGWCLYHLGEAEEARQMMKRHLEFTPEEGDSHYVIGLVALEEDDLEEAEARFRKADELQRDVPGREGGRSNALMKLGELHARRGELEPAREALEEAIALNPANDKALHQLSRVLMRLGEDELAEQVHEWYVEIRDRRRPRGIFPE